MSREIIWRLEPHVCRVCMARIVSREGEDDTGARHYECTNCGLSAEGHKASCLCACGTKIRNGKSAVKDAGLRCHANTARSPEFPALFVASFGGAQPNS